MSVLAAYAVPHPPLILPAIGAGREQEIAHTIDAYREVMRAAAELHPDTVVVISPHAVVYEDYFHISPGERAEGNFAAFGHPAISVGVDYDEDFVRMLAATAMDHDIPAGTLGEREAALDHGTMIPLAFLSDYLGDAPVKVVRIGISGLPAYLHARLGQCIAAVSERLGRRTVCIASGDLSHRLSPAAPNGFAAEGPEFDRLCTAFMGAGDFFSLLQIPGSFAETAGHCGLNGLWVLAGVLDGSAIESRLCSYEGPFGVGYAVASFTVTGTDESRDYTAQLVRAEDAAMEKLRASEDMYVRLARASVEHFVRTHSYAALPPDMPEELTEVRGFLSPSRNMANCAAASGRFCPHSRVSPRRFSTMQSRQRHTTADLSRLPWRNWIVSSTAWMCSVRLSRSRRQRNWIHMSTALS